MDNSTYKYKITESKNIHLNLKKIELDDNESANMSSRYNFDPLYADMKLAEIQRDMDNLQIQIEQRRYAEKNYDAICKQMYNYSIFQLIYQIIETVISIIKYN